MVKSERKIALKSAPAESIAGRGMQNPKAKSTTKRNVEGKHSSKQAQVIAMLRSPAGATIEAVMKATGWQQHSVRGFFAGSVRKRLRLKLSSKKVDGNRVYRIVGSANIRSPSEQSARLKA